MFAIDFHMIFIYSLVVQPEEIEGRFERRNIVIIFHSSLITLFATEAYLNEILGRRNDIMSCNNDMR